MFIVFIDDRAENVTVAVDHGMLGLHFRNPDELTQELVLLQLLPDQDASKSWLIIAFESQPHQPPISFLMHQLLHSKE